MKRKGMQLGVERNLHVEMPEEASFLLKVCQSRTFH